MATQTFTMRILQAQSGASARSVRHWIRQKLIPKPIGRGRGARYDDRHMVRARVIQHLRNAKVPLRQNRARISSLNEEQLFGLLPPDPRPTTADGAPLPPPDPTYPFSSWEVIQLMDGLFLFVDPTKGAVLRRIADDIYRYYGTPQRRVR